MKYSFGWRDPFYRRQKVSPALREGELSPGVEEEILEPNQLDLELYAYMRTRFDNRPRRQDDAFFAEVKEFRDANGR